MTPDEFDLTDWVSKMEIQIKKTGEVKKISSVDFEERLIGFHIDEEDGLNWVRCESVDLVKPDVEPKKDFDGRMPNLHENL